MSDMSASRFQNDNPLFQAMPVSLLRLSAGDVWKLIDMMTVTERDISVLKGCQTVICALANACFIQDLNDSACRLLGVERSMANARTPIATILTEDSRRLFADGLWRLSKGQRALAFEGSLVMNGGEVIPVAFDLWHGECCDTPPDDIYLSVMSTSQRMPNEQAEDRFQDELARSARIGLLGEMTASIAHEVNQPLGSIVASAEAGLRWLDRPEPNMVEIRQLLERIAKNGKRAADVISAMRAIATNQKPEHLPTALNCIIEEAVLLLRTDLARRQITLRLDLAPDLPLVKVDKIQILQVVVNLALNAAQAMFDGQAWNRTLSLRSRRLDRANVIVEVEDSGPGIDPGVRERLFESFYTTKETGIGMGLAICRSIIEAHGSRIDLHSSPHLGARFSFMLRAHDVEGDKGPNCSDGEKLVPR